VPFGSNYSEEAEDINSEIEILIHQEQDSVIYTPKGNCLLNNRVIYYFINLIAKALLSYQITEKISFLSKYRKNVDIIFDKKMSLIDFPLFAFGVERHLYDSEGAKCAKKVLISKGKINDYLSNKEDASVLNCTGGNAFAFPTEFQRIIEPTNIILQISSGESNIEPIDYIFDYVDLSFNFNIQNGDMSGIIWGRKLTGINKGYCRLEINDNIINFFNNITAVGRMHQYSGYYFPLISRVF